MFNYLFKTNKTQYNTKIFLYIYMKKKNNVKEIESKRKIVKNNAIIGSFPFSKYEK